MTARYPRMLCAGGCLVVMALFFTILRQGSADAGLPASQHLYNRLLDGFRAGQLNLVLPVPADFRALPDPYDPATNWHYRLPPYRLQDLSYYRGRLYLYFGPTPVLLLFWPWHLLTGHYLSQRLAVLIGCCLGYLGSVRLLWAACPRQAGRPGPMLLGVIGLGFCTGLPFMLLRTSVYEVPISCAFALVMASLCALERVLHAPRRGEGRWLMLASLLYGLAVGARPTLIFGAAVLAVPLLLRYRWRTFGRWRLLVAALLPVSLAVAVLLGYNWARFGHLAEFGQNYQLISGARGANMEFGLRHAPFNLRVYFLGQTPWRIDFPYLTVGQPAAPWGHNANMGEFSMIGILKGLPLVWLFLLAPLCALRPRNAGAHQPLLLILALHALASVAILAVYSGTQARYEVDFLPECVLAALIVGLALDDLLASRSQVRRLYQGLLAVALGWSLLWPSMSEVRDVAALIAQDGVTLAEKGRFAAAFQRYAASLSLYPLSPDTLCRRGEALLEVGRKTEALRDFERAARVDPACPEPFEFAEAHDDTGEMLAALPGRQAEAMAEFRLALRCEPRDMTAHLDLGEMLFNQRRFSESVAEFQRAVESKPYAPEPHYELGLALVLAGRTQEAIPELKQALRMDPHSAARIALQRLQ